MRFSQSMIKAEFTIRVMAKSPTLNVIISEKDKERLKLLAAIEKRSMSQLAAIAIEEYLDRHQIPATENTDKGAA